MHGKECLEGIKTKGKVRKSWTRRMVNKEKQKQKQRKPTYVWKQVCNHQCKHIHQQASSSSRLLSAVSPGTRAPSSGKRQGHASPHLDKRHTKAVFTATAKTEFTIFPQRVELIWCAIFQILFKFICGGNKNNKWLSSKTTVSEFSGRW